MAGLGIGPANLGTDEETHALFPNYWHVTDYMQHRIIGPVVLQVHEARKNDYKWEKVPNLEVLKPGTYTAFQG